MGTTPQNTMELESPTDLDEPVHQTIISKRTSEIDHDTFKTAVSDAAQQKLDTDWNDSYRHYHIDFDNTAGVADPAYYHATVSVEARSSDISPKRLANWAETVITDLPTTSGTTSETGP